MLPLIRAFTLLSSSYGAGVKMKKALRAMSIFLINPGEAKKAANSANTTAKQYDEKEYMKWRIRIYTIKLSSNDVTKI